MNEIKDFELFSRDRGVSPLYLDSYRMKGPQNYINPTIIEERTRNITAMDVFSKLLMDNIIFLGDQFDDNMANVIVSQLLWLQATKPGEDIKMYINSPGGSVTSGLAIKDTMDFVKNDVSTVCVGMAASMGAVILSNGTNGKRYAMPSSQILIHSVSSGTRGTICDMRIDLAWTENINNLIIDTLSNNTGKTAEEIRNAIDRDNWMNPNQAKEFGLIDQVITRK